MESSLHRALKARYGIERGGRAEVRVGRFRVDAIGRDGGLIEVQASRLGALRTKLERLLPDHPVVVVKPVIVARRIVRRARLDGPDLSSRKGPKSGHPVEVFDELVGLAGLFPHPNLTIEVLGVSIAEVRVGPPRRDRVVDRVLIDVRDMLTLRTAPDLWSLLPVRPDRAFTTLDLARDLGRSIGFAQRVAYCLRETGAIERRGVERRRRVYERSAEVIAGP